jgi:hypothetical protein
MRKDEFEELHGQGTWVATANMIQQRGINETIRANANIIVHNDIIVPILQAAHEAGIFEIEDQEFISLIQYEAYLRDHYDLPLAKKLKDFVRNLIGRRVLAKIKK